jgi:hypothetical protein
LLQVQQYLFIHLQTIIGIILYYFASFWFKNLLGAVGMKSWILSYEKCQRYSVNVHFTLVTNKEKGFEYFIVGIFYISDEYFYTRYFCMSSCIMNVTLSYSVICWCWLALRVIRLVLKLCTMRLVFCIASNTSLCRSLRVGSAKYFCRHNSVK